MSLMNSEDIHNMNNYGHHCTRIILAEFFMTNFNLMILYSSLKHAFNKFANILYCKKSSGT